MKGGIKVEIYKVPEIVTPNDDEKIQVEEPSNIASNVAAGVATGMVIGVMVDAVPGPAVPG